MSELNYPARQTQRWRQWRGLLLFIVLLILVRTTIVDWNHVPSRSMVPAIIPGDRIFVEKTAFGLRLPFMDAPFVHWSAPRRFDIIVFKAPQTELLTVKRIIGLPGDKVSWKHGRLNINGHTARYVETGDTNTHTARSLYSHTRQLSEEIMGEEHKILRYKVPSRRSGRDFDAVHVPDNQYLVLGDNRDNSGDYRTFGFVSNNTIIGKAKGILFSLDPEHYYIPRWQRGMSALQ